MALTPDTPLDEVLVKLKRARTRSNINQIAEVLLKSGPRAYKTAALLEVVNQKSGEFHHYSLVLEQVEYTKKGGWTYKREGVIRLEDKDQQEIHDLFVFLSTHYAGELKNKIGKIHVLSEDAYSKYETLVAAIPSIDDAEKLQLVKELLAHVEGRNREEFKKLFEETSGATLRHIAAASRMVEYTEAYTGMRELVDDPGSSENDFQKHLDKNPWMFGSEYSELLSR